MKKIQTNRGLVKTILLIIAALLILAYFGLNLRNITNSPTFQDNWSLIKDTSINVWDNYLKKPATYLWNEIYIKLIWEPAISNLTKIKDGQPDDIRTGAPVIPTPQPIPN